MRAFLIAMMFGVAGCLHTEPPPERGTAPDLPSWTVTLDLDRIELPATEDLSGTIVVAPNPVKRRDGSDAASKSFEIRDWRFELANEKAPLLDLVIEGDGGHERRRITVAEGATRFRFRISPCAEFVERSAQSPVALQQFDSGNHALRIVVAGTRYDSSASDNGVGTPIDHSASYSSRWTSLDVVEAGRPLDVDDVEAIVLSAEETRAASILDFYCARLGASDRMVAIVAHETSGLRRGRLATAVVRHVHRGEWRTDPGRAAFRSLFAEIDESGLDCRSHDAPPFFARFAVGRDVPIQIHSSELCNFKVLCVYEEGPTANFALSTRARTIDSGNLVTSRGLFRVSCDVHARIWGWILVE